MSDAAEPVLELRDVAVEYPGGIRAIDGIHLRVFPHDLLGLLGPNGAGKSTLLAVILGLQKPTRGSVRLFGRPVSPEGLRRLGYVPQRPQSTYPDFPATVLETVLLGRAARARPCRGVTRRERKEAEEILTLLDIHGLRGRSLGRLRQLAAEPPHRPAGRLPQRRWPRPRAVPRSRRRAFRRVPPPVARGAAPRPRVDAPHETHPLAEDPEPRGRGPVPAVAP